jgi:DNA-binding MarR family transcriptional regulator
MARRVINTCLAGRVRQISRVVTAHYDEALRPIGITANQLTILSAVALLDKVTQAGLQPYLQMEVSTLSRNVSRMIENHWLATMPGSDRRSHYLVVAPEGLRVLERVKPHWEKAHAWATEMLGGEDAVRQLAHRVNPLVPR